MKWLSVQPAAVDNGDILLGAVVGTCRGLLNLSHDLLKRERTRKRGGGEGGREGEKYVRERERKRELKRERERERERERDG